MNKKLFLLLGVLIGLFYGVNAQFAIHPYIDVGDHNASEGGYVRNAVRANYPFQKYFFAGGLQFDIISANTNTLTGVDFLAGRNFIVQNTPFYVNGFWMLNRFSDLMYETNWGGRIGSQKLPHFLVEFGVNFKTYRINSSARDQFGIPKSDSRLSENFNLTYQMAYYVKPHSSDWNIRLLCANVDYYLINQSTNPLFSLQGWCKITPRLTICADTWYKQAGVFNFYANYFGYFFRGGIKLEL